MSERHVPSPRERVRVREWLVVNERISRIVGQA